MEGGPWAFHGQPVLLAPYDDFSKPSSIDLNSFKIWVQIHDLPDGFEKLMKPLAEKIGVFYAEDKDAGDYAGNFYRARVVLDVRNLLKIMFQWLGRRKGRFLESNMKGSRIGVRSVG